MDDERPQRRKFPDISEQMKAWSSAISDELRDWPTITQKSFFGFTALYRGNSIFGLLPRTRSIFRGNAIAFRFDRRSKAMCTRLESDARIRAFDRATFDKDKTRWFTLELSADSDLRDALDYLGEAFKAARNPKKKK